MTDRERPVEVKTPASDLAAALAELTEGCTQPEHIAARIAEANVTGEKQDSCTCPVAWWLRAKLGETNRETLLVTPYWVYWWPTVMNMAEVSQAIPDLLRVFIGLFDSGRYPELEATGA